MADHSNDHKMEDAEMEGAGNTAPLDKGKGKAPQQSEQQQQQNVEEDDDSSSEESGAEDQGVEEEVEEEDNMEEIDPSNILPTGRRTRGKNIDFAKAAQELPDDDSEDDEDFKEPTDAMEE